MHTSQNPRQPEEHIEVYDLGYMYTIPRDSQAGRFLDQAFKREVMHTLRFEFRNVTVEPGPYKMAFKVNEDVWSPSLSVDPDGRVYKAPVESLTEVTGLECSDCGKIVFSIADAKDHEEDPDLNSDPDSSTHGGWDTVTLNTTLELSKGALKR